jgi:cell division septation protein DedD
MEEHTADDSSHYEISLTAGQAFVAFVLLMLSLAASFAFGLMLGKGQADDRLVVQKETPVVTEAALAPKKESGEIVELGVAVDDFADSDEEPVSTDSAAAPATDSAAAPAESPAIVETSAPAVETPKPAVETPKPASEPVATPAAAPASAAPKVPHLAQLLSTSDQKTAEALAVKLINRGFNAAYVERGATDKGPVFRVRVRFDSEQEARGAEPKLREFSKEVWITAR